MNKFIDIYNFSEKQETQCLFLKYYITIVNCIINNITLFAQPRFNINLLKVFMDVKKFMDSGDKNVIYEYSYII